MRREEGGQLLATAVWEAETVGWWGAEESVGHSISGWSSLASSSSPVGYTCAREERKGEGEATAEWKAKLTDDKVALRPRHPKKPLYIFLSSVRRFF